MTASHGAGEITFYEELGVEPGASPEEIRDAFRSLVRLLHPDQQIDAQLKEIAEKQMRKLNRIYAVLSDPVSRRRYDEDLEDDTGTRIVVNPSWPAQKRLAGRVAWAGAILISAGLLLWLAADYTPEPATRPHYQSNDSAYIPPSPERPVDAVKPSTEVARLLADLAAVTVERDAAVSELNRLRGRPAAADSGNLPLPKPSDLRSSSVPRSPAITMTELPSASRLPSVAPVRLERVPSRQIGGFWFYVKPPQGQQNKNRALYPPEYIEVTIAEENGQISGKYRSRFQIGDRAISPDVNFTFTGAETGSSTDGQWTGAAGARGDLTLKLTSDNTLRIDWMATDLGTQQGLNSGTAILTRRIE
jgi:hypothetical protein